MLMCRSLEDRSIPPLARLLSQSVNDAGFKVGFSVQTARQAHGLALRAPASFSSMIDSRLLIGSLRQDAYQDHPLALSNQGFVPQLVVRGSTAPAPLQSRSRPPASSEA